MGYPSDLTDAEFALLLPLLNFLGKSGPKFKNLRKTINGLRYQARTGCQWRYIPKEYGKWSALRSQFHRWSKKGTWATVLAALQPQARCTKGRKNLFASMIIIDPALLRGASNGGKTFHNKGGPHGATNGTKNVIAVDVTGLPLAAVAVPANTSDGACAQLLLEHMKNLGLADSLLCVKIDKGIHAATAARLGKMFGVKIEIYGNKKLKGPKGPKGVFVPVAQAWKVEAAHATLGRYRRIAKSYENTTMSATAWLQMAAVDMVLKTLT